MLTPADVLDDAAVERIVRKLVADEGRLQLVRSVVAEMMGSEYELHNVPLSDDEAVRVLLATQGESIQDWYQRLKRQGYVLCRARE